MKIAIAPNAFRGSLTAIEAVECIAAGFRQAAIPNLELISMPLADGGDGTLDTLLSQLGGEKISVTVCGPDGEPVAADMGLLADGRTAVIEMARASGVELIPLSRRNPLITTTYGTGELIRAAWDRGYREFLIGIGGSATVDGGAGCFQAVGAQLLDRSGAEIPRGGGSLSELAAINVSALVPFLAEGKFTVLSDVTNPLLGENGAARVFGPQKGANPVMVEQLEAALTNFASVIKQDLGIEVVQLAGGGAAGGFGAGLVAFLNASITPGAAELISLLNYNRLLAGVNLLITGEGKLDAQTSGGKAVQTIAQLAHQQGIPVVALAGKVETTPASLAAMGVRSAWSIVPGPCSLDEAIRHAREWLTNAALNLGQFVG
jgi:glycerate 2-kinase